MKKLTFLAVSSLLILGACHNNDDDHTTPPTPTPPAPAAQTYTVTVTNLTANQPLSPISVLLHQAEVSPWTVAMPASLALEMLAESGDASEFSGVTGVDSLVVDGGPLGPGGTSTQTIEIQPSAVAQLSVLTMLVNTNDAFTGLADINLAELQVGDSMTRFTMAYDAGTEANSEAKGTIPGPADGGEGFNTTREANDAVRVHQGVLSSDDGLSNSVLNASHRFDNPVARVSISRTN
ncbi:spondin domain-containing protein [Shewanella sp. NIFS-20-20]|uniref:spondin domain-containing protein n=1 Tax=Shewanella sp. NIFS-20-20 TaxID=2853806 RepID=UPI001C488054|nr:spondin domain-containing protein [Shewanella sp. NIFS-20-20]MBV7316482.1 spondin domain-containing protein [Shewanella sp. NIFS-20-20]